MDPSGNEPGNSEKASPDKNQDVIEKPIESGIARAFGRRVSRLIARIESAGSSLLSSEKAKLADISGLDLDISAESADSPAAELEPKGEAVPDSVEAEVLISEDVANSADPETGESSSETPAVLEKAKPEDGHVKPIIVDEVLETPVSVEEDVTAVCEPEKNCQQVESKTETSDEPVSKEIETEVEVAVNLDVSEVVVAANEGDVPVCEPDVATLVPCETTNLDKSVCIIQDDLKDPAVEESEAVVSISEHNVPCVLVGEKVETISTACMTTDLDDAAMLVRAPDDACNPVAAAESDSVTSDGSTTDEDGIPDVPVAEADGPTESSSLVDTNVNGPVCVVRVEALPDPFAAEGDLIPGSAVRSPEIAVANEPTSVATESSESVEKIEDIPSASDKISGLAVSVEPASNLHEYSSASTEEAGSSDQLETKPRSNSEKVIRFTVGSENNSSSTSSLCSEEAEKRTKGKCMGWLKKRSSQRFMRSPQKLLSRLRRSFRTKGARPTLSSDIEENLERLSPHLSPIPVDLDVFCRQEMHYFAESDHQEKIDRIDYANLAEDKIIPTFLNSCPCYDVMPRSAKVIVFSVELLVKNAFGALLQNDIKSAPLWDASSYSFIGMLTISDFINVLRYYYTKSPENIKDVENQSIATWRSLTEVSKPFVKVDGMEMLSKAAKLMILEGVHRIPVFDEKRQCVLFVLTRRRLLHHLHDKFLSNFDKMKLKTPTFFHKSIKELQVGTFENIATVMPKTRLIDALDLMVERKVSALPVVDENNQLVDIFGKVYIFALAKEQAYHNLNMTIDEAIDRSLIHDDAYGCSMFEPLGSVIEKFVSTKAHQLVVINEKQSVVGMVSLSDILKFLVIHPLASMEDSGMSVGETIEETPEGATASGSESNSDVFPEIEDGPVSLTNEMAGLKVEQSTEMPLKD